MYAIRVMRENAQTLDAIRASRPSTNRLSAILAAMLTTAHVETKSGRAPDPHITHNFHLHRRTRNGVMVTDTVRNVFQFDQKILSHRAKKKKNG
jgi:hypothetical protein